MTTFENLFFFCFEDLSSNIYLKRTDMKSSKKDLHVFSIKEGFSYNGNL